MKICDFLEGYLEEDLVSKIYNNNCDFAEYIPNKEEYLELIKLMKVMEKELINIKGFKRYLEIRNEKDSIEAEEQFKLGFKTAVKIIIESYHL